MRAFLLVIMLSQWSVAQPISWTNQERSLLDAHPLTCISTPFWAPFNTEIDGKLAGIGIEYWRLITERLHIPFRCKRASSWDEVLKSLREKKEDLTVASEATLDRTAFSSFSKPYVTYPYVVVTRKDVGFVYDIHMLHGKNIVVGKGYSVVSVLKKHYPKLSVSEVPSIDDALKAVAEGHAYAAIDVLPVLAYKLNNEHYTALKISGMLPEIFSAHIMLRKDYENLLPLINRAIDTITDEERLAINEKWTRVYAPSTMPSVYFYTLIGIAFLLLFLLYVRTRRLKQEMGNKEIDMKHLEEMARIDSLTKVNNRRMLDTVLAQHLAIAERYRQLLSVVFFDIDSFKAINDRYGHNIGDDVLIELTHLVSGSIRGSDVFGRWGGDEFLIILPESSQKQARRLAKSLHQKIIDHSFPGVPRVSCSFGVVAYQYGDTIKTLVARADDALYKAKKHKDSSPFI